ncbi:MAG: nucleotidyltransferase family protein [Ignavibacteriae bacterium]|nr:MAG: nucleotidyltransferase family protein [Ignavibacteriota bacterium]
MRFNVLSDDEGETMQNQLDIIILAAGFGTRLYPLTLNLPKAFLEIGHKTILDRIMSRVILIDSPMRIFLVANSKYYSQFVTWAAAFKQSGNLNGDIFVLDDGKYTNEERLGPIGDMNFVLDKFNITNDLMILASDNVIDFDLNDLISLRQDRGSSVLAAFDFHDKEAVKKKFGVVQLDSNNKLLSFDEKPESPDSSIAATGIYLIRNEDVQHIRTLQARTHKGELNLGNLMIELLARSTVHCLLVPKWFDIGSVDDLKNANKKYAAA